ncbi:topoisomerase DNA-binding C4 zinc finger domain-containing protein [Mesorhizobium sp. M1163]|uniref:topoisomerase DNA-binding C4 zinc finger domain-containing protein n=1 Tax=Mesorhizobium sp. M1163 TaxID=2957065 RepID=UPI0033363317
MRYATIEGAALRQCPVCLVGQMVEKRNRNGTVFHGCNQFPDCRHSEGVPAQSTAHLDRRA